MNLPVDVSASLSYILQDQDSEGSFGNLAITAFVLPTLTGRSILNVKSVACPADRSSAERLASGRMRVKLSIQDDVYAQRVVDTRIVTDSGRNILQIMNEQSEKHPRAYQYDNDHIYVILTYLMILTK